MGKAKKPSQNATVATSGKKVRSKTPVHSTARKDNERNERGINKESNRSEWNCGSKDSGLTEAQPIAFQEAQASLKESHTTDRASCECTSPTSSSSRKSSENQNSSHSRKTNLNPTKLFGPFEVQFISEEEEEEIGSSKKVVSLRSKKKEAQGRSTPRPNVAPIRRYNCDNYQSCLELAAALNWESFTCLGCSGEINDKLIWKAHLAQKGDNIAQKLCDLPKISCHEHDDAYQQVSGSGESFNKGFEESGEVIDFSTSMRRDSAGRAKRPSSSQRLKVQPLHAKLVKK